MSGLARKGDRMDLYHIPLETIDGEPATLAEFGWGLQQALKI